MQVDLYTVKPVLSGHSKRRPTLFSDRLWLNAGQKYCRMLQWEHSTIPSTFITLPFVIMIFVLFILEGPFQTGTLLYVHSSIAIILMGKRELIALLNLSSWCLVMVERLFLAVPRGCLQFVIVVFPDHTIFYCNLYF